MRQGFSKQNQRTLNSVNSVSSVDSAYRFGDFELFPGNRLLKRAGVDVALQPKAFDALLYLVRRAEHLVSKRELVDTLWPAVHVSEANLTNIVVSLRKVVGRETIRTVSKHGYRFELKVTGEPGVRRATYERFARAKELTAQRSLESMSMARDLYFVCVAEDPGFAPAWAWLGRCCWFLGKFSGTTSLNVELAQAALQRAFELDPELGAAHQFSTVVECDSGRADAAMERLLKRLAVYPSEPESYMGLVQVFRFRGMLKESMEAHRRAVSLDPATVTSVAHTLFLGGEYGAAIESYGGRAAYYLDAAAWAALEDRRRAIAVLRERLERMPLSELMVALMRSLLAVLEGRKDEAAGLMASADTTLEPEIMVYFARHYAKLGLIDEAVGALRSAAIAGFVCSPETLRTDAWLAGARGHRGFESLVSDAERLVGQGRVSLATCGAGSGGWASLG